MQDQVKLTPEQMLNQSLINSTIEIEENKKKALAAAQQDDAGLLELEQQQLQEETKPAVQEFTEEKIVSLEQGKEKPTEEAKVTDDPAKPAEGIQEEDGVIQNWNAETDDEPKKAEVSYPELASELGLESAESKEGIRLQVQKLKDQVNDQSEKLATFSDIPSELEAIVQVARESGDWKAYMQAIQQDYSKISDYEMVYNNEAQHFPDTAEGNADLEEHMSAKKEYQISMEGKNIRNALQSRQAEKIAAIKSASTVDQAEKAKSISSALSGVSDVHDFKVTDNDLAKYSRELQNGTLESRLFKDANGKDDYQKQMRVAFVVDNFDKIVRFLRGNTKAITTKALVNSITNAAPSASQDSTTRITQQPKQLSGLDMMMEKEMKKNFDNHYASRQMPKQE